MSHILLSICLICFCALGFVCVDGRRILFENVVQNSGHNNILVDLRVRKFNRTLTVLNGSIVTFNWIDDIPQLSLDLFYSRLGNQQFNHYPMKFPSCGTCSFIDHMHRNYGKYIAPLKNFPALGECPFSPRSINIVDFAFPEEAVPMVMPLGLWKVVISQRKKGEKTLDFYYLIKSDNF
ncbi:uncharacterized protein LOC120902787 [Anopheles arabiensis]|uniref:uncharacterized protein LOC120902787 n=1 Tax=Anopheles arabiensis TaxID=7173 RepID=UPI001AAC63D8|nr:uncharacterized protein LOC120902787 [Anopheles arabiensis]